MRIKATIAYDGSRFYGFQKQKSTPQTVVGNLEKALGKIQIKSEVVGSGRTDRGVHATGQVIHFDIPSFWSDTNRLKDAIQRQLEGIEIRYLEAVPSTFHARFNAKRRLYRYIFKTTKPTVFESRFIAYYPYDFDVERLKEGLCMLEGIHDFTLFHKQGSSPHTTIRTLYRNHYYTYRNYHIITFEANGFLRSQVRMMVDTVMAYANKKLTKEAFQKQIEAKEQAHHKLAPAEGLYLAKIIY